MCQFNFINCEKIFIFLIKFELYLFTNICFMDTMVTQHMQMVHFVMSCRRGLLSICCEAAGKLFLKPSGDVRM